MENESKRKLNELEPAAYRIKGEATLGYWKYIEPEYKENVLAKDGFDNSTLQGLHTAEDIIQLIDKRIEKKEDEIARAREKYPPEVSRAEGKLEALENLKSSLEVEER